MKRLIPLLLLSQSVYAAPLFIERTGYTYNRHEVTFMTYQEDPFYEVHILVDDEEYATVSQIPENMIDFAYAKIRSKLDQELLE